MPITEDERKLVYKWFKENGQIGTAFNVEAREKMAYGLIRELESNTNAKEKERREKTE